MNILELVRQEASEVYKVEEELNAFMNGFEKQASTMLEKKALFGSAARFTTRMMRDVPGGVAKAGIGLAAGLIGVGVVKAMTSADDAITNYALKSKFESALQQVRTTNKIVKNANQSKVDSYANTLFTFAPHVASDPNILSTLLSNAVLGEGIDPMTMKSISDLEGRYVENNAPQPPLGIRI